MVAVYMFRLGVQGQGGREHERPMKQYFVALMARMGQRKGQGRCCEGFFPVFSGVLSS